MALTLDDIARLFATAGNRQYSGEPVTQREHALQAAWLAESAGEGDAMVTACLLHDLGHLLNDQGESPTLKGIDDTHQYYAIPFLRGLFDAAVLEPIRLHVDAKRWLCATLPGYPLSADSRRSLALQGGIFTAAEAAAFIARPGAADAVKLRRWDDAAKVSGLPTPPLAHFLDRARRCATQKRGEDETC